MFALPGPTICGLIAGAPIESAAATLAGATARLAFVEAVPRITPTAAALAPNTRPTCGAPAARETAALVTVL